MSACTTNKECADAHAANWTCVAKKCIAPPCKTSGDCGGGTCVNQKCVLSPLPPPPPFTPCKTNNECETAHARYWTCVKEKCVSPECFNHYDCDVKNKGWVCSKGKCEAPFPGWAWIILAVIVAIIIIGLGYAVSTFLSERPTSSVRTTASLREMTPVVQWQTKSTAPP